MKAASFTQTIIEKKSFPILLVPIFWLASFWSISVLGLVSARVGIRNQYVSSWRAIRKFITCTKVWHTPPDKKVPNVRDCRANDIDNGHANIMDIVTCHVKVSHTATQLALTHYPMPDGIMTDTHQVWCLLQNKAKKNAITSKRSQPIRFPFRLTRQEAKVAPSSFLFSRGSWKQRQRPTLLLLQIRDHVCGALVPPPPFQQLYFSRKLVDLFVW